MALQTRSVRTRRMATTASSGASSRRASSKLYDTCKHQQHETHTARHSCCGVRFLSDDESRQFTKTGSGRTHDRRLTTHVRVASCRVVSCRIASRRVVSCRVASFRFAHVSCSHMQTIEEKEGKLDHEVKEYGSNFSQVRPPAHQQQQQQTAAAAEQQQPPATAAECNYSRCRTWAR